MKKISNVKQAIAVAKQLHLKNKKIVLVGGCFDILHLGHVVFLEKAKQKGDILFVWVESDEMVQKQKGHNRPIHSQKDRASVLAALSSVDYVIMLPPLTENGQYDKLVKDIKPAIIATTKGDPEVRHKKRSARVIGAKVLYVTNRIHRTSTSRLAELIAREE